MARKKLPKKNVEWSIFVIFMLISTVGLLTLASLSADRIFFKKQLLWHFIGLFVFFCIIMFFNKRRLKEWSFMFYFIAIVILAIVLVAGKTSKGAQRWISLGFFNVQPSELAKIALALTLARLYEKLAEARRLPMGLKETLLVLLVSLPMFLLTLMQPDLGTALMFLLIAGTMGVSAGIKKHVVGIAVVSMVVFFIAGWAYFFEDYQKARIIGFLNPYSDPTGKGYHIIQSRIAIGSGRIWGKGFSMGTQSRLKFIPERHTDFIFSTFAEDWGFLGVLFLFTLYVMFLYRILELSRLCSDCFSYFAVIGLGSIFFWHIAINLGMTMGVLPVVGVPLPMMSYGGSVTLSSYIALSFITVLVRER